MTGEKDFWEKVVDDSGDTLGVKKVVIITFSCTVLEINAFLRFTKKLKMAAKNDGKRIFGEKRQITLRIPWGSKILLKALSILHRFQDKCVFVFYAEIQDGCQKWRKKSIFGKNWQMTAYTIGVKISSKSLYLAPFLRY